LKADRRNEIGGSYSTYGETRGAYRWRNVREREHLGEPGVIGRIILKWIFRK
jgi:hypothetical protein